MNINTKIITDAHMLKFQGEIVKYMNNEKPVGKFSDKTILLDLLFLMGLSIDPDKYGPDATGFDEFKKVLREVIDL